MDYMCGDCGSDDVVAIATFGSLDVDHVCAACGSTNILGVDLSRKYKRTDPPSVGRMLHRQRKAEQNLPPSPLEKTIQAKQASGLRQDLVELLTELA